MADFGAELPELLHDAEVPFAEVDIGMGRGDIETGPLGDFPARSVLSGEEAGRQRAVGQCGDLLFVAVREQFFAGPGIGEAE